MSTARIPDGTPLGLVQVGLAVYRNEPTWANVDMSTIPQTGRSDPPVKPTSEVAHQPGQQPAAALVISQGWMWRCLACGELDGTFIDREMCEASAIHHHNECEGPS